MSVRLEQHSESESVEERIAALRATPEELAALLATARSFDVDTWMKNVPPATPEEIAETDEFLAEIRADRDQELSGEAKESLIP